MIAKIESFGTNCLLNVSLEVENNYQKAASLPGFKKWHGRAMIFRPTVNNIAYIAEHWPDAQWHPDTQHHLDSFIEEQKKKLELGEKKDQVIEDGGSYIYKTEPMDHQRQLFLLSRDEPAFAFLMEQGCGKTKPDIDTSAYLYAQGKIDAFIVIAPNGVHTNWQAEEIPKHLPDWCPHKVWVYSSPMTKTKKQALEETIAAVDTLKIFCFNIEAFGHGKTAKEIFERLLRTFPKIKISIDESQFIKNPSANRTRYLTKACEAVPYKRILTGTAITKGAGDVYAQFRWLNPDILGYDSFYTFRGRFCRMGGFKDKQIIGYKNLDELIGMISPYSFRVTKDQCLDLPSKVYKRCFVDLTPQQRKLYDQLANDYYAEMEGVGQISAPLAIVRLMRLQQITCGWMPGEDGETMRRIPGENPKMDATMRHVEDQTSPSLIWARFIPDIEAIVEELRRAHGKDSVAMYRGGMKADVKTGLIRDFQAGNLKALVCSKAAARGLTLTACENPFYHSMEYDLEIRLQSEDRCHRKGTVNSVVYTDCVANKTLDNKIIRSLISKKTIADIINQDGPSFFMQET